MRFILMFFILSYTASAVDYTHYYNGLAQITGIIDSKTNGLIIANSTGVYSIDKESGDLERIPSTTSRLIAFNHFFEYNGEVYCYKEETPLFRIRDNKLEEVANNVVAHYVLNGKLYLLKSKEPRVCVMDAEDNIKGYNLGDDGFHLYAEFIEVKGEVYAYVGLNFSGSRFIVKVKENGIDFIMDPGNSEHDSFRDMLPSRLYSINDEICFQAHTGIYKFVNGKIVKLDDSFNFDDSFSYKLIYEDGFVYGINQKGLYKSNYSTKETTYFVEDSINYKNQMFLFRGEKYFYYCLDGAIYTYDPNTEEFKEFQRADEKKIRLFIEGLDSSLFIVKDNAIEWYKDNPPVIFGNSGIVTNEFYDIGTDRKNGKYIALGLAGDDFVIQTYDLSEWEVIETPCVNTHSEGMIITDAALEADLDGNYYLSVDDYLGIWNGSEWTRISYLTYPVNADKLSEEAYNVLCRDSTGSVWISGYTREFDDNIQNYKNRNFIIKSTKDSFEIVTEVDRNYAAYFNNGLCLTNGDVVIESWEDKMYYHGSMDSRIIEIEDGYNLPIINPIRNFCQNSKGELVVLFNAVSGWDIDYGDYKSPGGISVFNGFQWKHEEYDDAISKGHIQFYGNYMVFDKDGNDFILTDGKLVSKSSNKLIQEHYEEALRFHVMDKMTQTGNEVWVAYSGDGIYQIFLPYVNKVEEDKEDANRLLKSQIITNGELELLQDINNYMIYTNEGKLIGSGGDNNTIDVSNLSSGAYNILAKSMNRKYSEKFIISR